MKSIIRKIGTFKLSNIPYILWLECGKRYNYSTMQKEHYFKINFNLDRKMYDSYNKILEDLQNNLNREFIEMYFHYMGGYPYKEYVKALIVTTDIDSVRNFIKFLKNYKLNELEFSINDKVESILNEYKVLCL